ncbi:MAG TPA: peptidylprolyl isomerase [Chloroflexota bacterium]|nr:peptidylprolyl isomerase [Chloroflexota bacterium]
MPSQRILVRGMLALVVATSTIVAAPVASALSRPAAHAADKIRLPGAKVVKQPSVCKGYKTYGVPMVDRLQPGKTYTAKVSTNKGDFTITLWPGVAPIAVMSFVFLAQHHYFDGVIFHRVIPGFVVQGGDPTGTGYCGPGYEFKDEPVHHPYTRGVVAMANAGADTNGSQFFIMLADNQLPPNYTIFGGVQQGMSVVDAIAKVPLKADAGGDLSAPTQKVYMKRVTIQIK